MPPNFVSSFSVIRAKMEKLIEDGFSFKIPEKKASKIERKEPVLSPLEMIHH
jgi:hypothetical protein